MPPSCQLWIAGAAERAIMIGEQQPTGLKPQSMVLNKRIKRAGM